MSMNIPKDPADTPGLTEEARANIKAQQEMSRQNNAMQIAMIGLQQKIHEQEQEAMTLSNIEKGKDEAMKAVIQNIK
jgi:hypothetical protein